jgi:hypothetical protein
VIVYKQLQENPKLVAGKGVLTGGGVGTGGDSAVAHVSIGRGHH